MRVPNMAFMPRSEHVVRVIKILIEHCSPRYSGVIRDILSVTLSKLDDGGDTLEIVHSCSVLLFETVICSARSIVKAKLGSS